ncbi:DNA-binding domain-containing protein, AraC-type [Polaromonas sp. CF318]|uniref:helix-turn-helix domain-containing protein n=1 Tax=Polaromonas sp. CF318 TaxID=1144318 RepID=UPI000270DB61|nr:helix-turn-helix domain-containing protein [Polaromonas sp. CF318]EJL82768.1 DNA-binding domain-containing protein, AraC-type [Polaromonas sp. CF318]
MDVLTFSTERHAPPDRAESWQKFICDMIHNVAVKRFSPADFSAQISARRQGDVSCAAFRSRPHDLAGRGERASDAGGAGYLLSWQLAGKAYITQGDTRIVLHPGELAVIDGRLPMQISFPDDVSRIVAKLPVRSIESRLPDIRRSHAFALRPSGPFSEVLLSYLKELASGTQDFTRDEVNLLADNICNLLKITSRQGGVASAAPRDLQREAVLNYIRRRAGDPALSLDVAAGQLNMSTRLVQKLLQEVETSFTGLLTRERLALAAQLLAAQRGASVADVAFSAGFNDVSHFNHLFKRHHGMTPSEYRAGV